MSRVIEAFLEEAADEFAENEAVSLDTMMKLEGEGYLLRALDKDIQRILADR